MKSYYAVKVENAENLQFVNATLEKTFNPGEVNTIIVDTEKGEVQVIPGRFGDEIIEKHLNELGFKFEKMIAQNITVDAKGNLELGQCISNKHQETASAQFVPDMGQWAAEKVWESSMAKYPFLKIKTTTKSTEKLIPKRRYVKGMETRKRHEQAMRMDVTGMPPEEREKFLKDSQIKHPEAKIVKEGDQYYFIR